MIKVDYTIDENNKSHQKPKNPLRAQEEIYLSKFTCPNCLAVLEKGEGHFFPPRFGEEGFFICEEPIPPDAVRVIDGNFWGTTSMTIQEIIHNKKFTRNYESNDAYTKEYCRHIGYGSSGQFDDKTGEGTICSHLEECKILENIGYKNLNFCNGGDDDILVVDHDRKEFGFVEYGDSIKIGQKLA